MISLNMLATISLSMLATISPNMLVMISPSTLAMISLSIRGIFIENKTVDKNRYDQSYYQNYSA